MNLEPTRFIQPEIKSFDIRLIAIWTGRSLLGLAAVALVLSAVWLMPDLVQVAGSYAVTGVAMVVVGRPPLVSRDVRGHDRGSAVGQ